MNMHKLKFADPVAEIPTAETMLAASEAVAALDPSVAEMAARYELEADIKAAINRDHDDQCARRDVANTIIAAVERRQGNAILSPADAQLIYVMMHAVVALQRQPAATLAPAFGTASGADEIARGAAAERVLAAS